MILSILSPIVSVIALAVSLFTLWFTVLRRGTVRSTHPAFIAVRYDFVRKAVPQAKIFLRALLFSTGKRGRVVESLFLRVHHQERKTEFSFWGMGDKDLVRGSGLFIPETGIATNHHFNPLHADELFVFEPEIYSIELVAKLLGRQKLTSLWRIPLQIPDGSFGDDIAPDTAVFFNWSAETGRYVVSVESRPGQLSNSPALGN
ncbi:MAG: hypothetical protein EOR68_12775 [Mesorhizobium sp.]|uniref:hypothetical protein n=1 Tax=Mesorhizobium sp. TaxID=1871066 RepID=UPI000FE56813|nr:hypothetical protein [Mesorhizobium sp.]RWL99700.1 MAG: hypothetical protein EOR68_12775 [Mesorhizobium sp.]